MSHERGSQEPTVADSLGGSGERDDDDWRGKLLGRYVVVGLLGAGGFGVVLSAFDPDLGRRVAIKLVVAPGEAADAAQARLAREGKAIARLSHPNVVSVHDVGIAGGRVFVAMEHVDGVDLRAWLATPGRPPAEVLDAFVRAGRGLAAVHKVGIVHRDFKPANVLVGRDGQVKVADFGLAREATAAAEPAGSAAPGARIAAAGDHAPAGLAALTLKRGPLGTPGYMAPEQFLGEPATAASDQFSFCVALYEALALQKPFAGHDLPAVQDEVRAGRVRAWPRGNPTPAWLRGLIARGLSFEAAARFPSLTELLDRIEEGLRLRGRQRRLVVAGLAALALVGGGLFLARREDPAVARCRVAGESLGGAWAPARRAAVEQAFLATGRPYAAATFARLAGMLDRYASSWKAMRVESCAATHVRGEQSAALLDLRTRCLDRHRAALDALTSLYAGVPGVAPPGAPAPAPAVPTLDAAALDAALAAAGNLPPLADCADAAALTAVTPLPRDPARRARLAALDEELARVAALDAAGQHASGAPRARAAAAEALALAYPPAVAAALHRRASFERALGDARAAHLTLEQALDAAVAAGDDEREAQIWIAELELRANELLEPAAALALERTAATALARAGTPTRLHLRFLGAVAGAHQAAAAYGAAATKLSEALVLARRELGADDPLTLELELGLATQLIYSSDFARAHELLTALLPIATRELGESHPFTIRVIADTGVAYLEERKDAEARPWLERAARLYEAAYGPVHPRLAATLSNLAIVLRRQKDLEGALALSERVLAIDIATRGPEHPDVAGSWNQVGMLLRDLGRYEEARAKHLRALAIYEKTLGPRHRDVARVHNSLALTYEQEGRDPEAQLPHMEKELEIRLGYPEQAVPLGKARFGLGKHLHELGREPARSRTLLAQARQTFVDAKEEPWVKKVDDWLAKKKLPPLAPP